MSKIGNAILFLSYLQNGKKYSIKEEILNNIGPRNHIIQNGKVIHYEKCLCEKLNIE